MLQKIDGVREVRTALGDQSARVFYDEEFTGEADLRRILDEGGYPPAGAAGSGGAGEDRAGSAGPPGP
ncbi:MAG: heavy-metal-associated domain-containing protein [Firmicutes bacterium]|nr:heavy-metal-associated domain-containing protein [Bacillota bacterium]